MTRDTLEGGHVLFKGFYVYEDCPWASGSMKTHKNRYRYCVHFFSTVFLLLLVSYLKLAAGASEAAVIMEMVSGRPLMTLWEGVRASLHDHRLHQNQGSWGRRGGWAMHQLLSKSTWKNNKGRFSQDLEKPYQSINPALIQKCFHQLC